MGTRTDQGQSAVNQKGGVGSLLLLVVAVSASVSAAVTWMMLNADRRTPSLKPEDFVQAGPASPAANTTIPPNAQEIAELAALRSQDLLQRAQNTHQLLREILAGNIGQASPHNRVNDLNNELVDLWMAIASAGLGTEPFQSNINVSSNGFKRPDPAPNFGFPSYAHLGFPRLYANFLRARGVPLDAIEPQVAEFSGLVKPYANPARYPHRDFYERAYNNYREGKELDTERYTADLERLDRWLSELENVLQRLPGFFVA